jgi:5-methyltetrahydropteroyltriglutamate--homocysteine methyltransferase
MTILTDPIGSIPRPEALRSAIRQHSDGKLSDDSLRAAEEAALRDTIARFERTGSSIISDGEQTKPSFAAYPLAGLTNCASDGVVISFEDGHTRQLPRLTTGPFRFGTHAVSYLETACRF